MNRHSWKDEAECLGFDTNLYFDKYEENESLRPVIDKRCRDCAVMRTCFAFGVSGKEWGVWGGIYLENGEISREFNRHKSKEDWSETWKSLTMGS